MLNCKKEKYVYTLFLQFLFNTFPSISIAMSLEKSVRNQWRVIREISISCSSSTFSTYNMVVNRGDYSGDSLITSSTYNMVEHRDEYSGDCLINFSTYNMVVNRDEFSWDWLSTFCTYNMVEHRCEYSGDPHHLHYLQYGCEQELLLWKKTITPVRGLQILSPSRILVQRGASFNLTFSKLVNSPFNDLVCDFFWPLADVGQSVFSVQAGQP